jgi:hypothetical protein
MSESAGDTKFSTISATNQINLRRRKIAVKRQQIITPGRWLARGKEYRISSSQATEV